MQEIAAIIREKTGAAAIAGSEEVQSLWSGYGQIRRYYLEGASLSSIIAKHVVPPDEANHPKGWISNRSHQRKLRSYQVEMSWYQLYASEADAFARMPSCIYASARGNEYLVLLEDLNAAGYRERRIPKNVRFADARACLRWLARFHAYFIGASAPELWPVGTYWHLETRPDEWGQMKNKQLKAAASAIDSHLKTAEFQTIVHGDAKLANFCFSSNGEVAALDFQYVGKGCGMKDVAYFISSCFGETNCEKYEEELLSHYFNQLKRYLPEKIDFQLLKEEWIQLYAYAWADFFRFLDGWSPGHWKMHGYSQNLVNRVLKDLNNESER